VPRCPETERAGDGWPRSRVGEQGADECFRCDGDRPVADLPVAEFDDPPHPVGAQGQIHRHEGQPQRRDRRAQRTRVEVRGRGVVRAVRMRADQDAAAVDPPRADLGAGEPLEPAQHEATDDVLPAQVEEPARDRPGGVTVVQVRDERGLVPVVLHRLGEVA